MMKYLIVSYTIALLSCSSTGYVNCENKFVYNPNDFTLEEQGWIVESADRWNIYTNQDVMNVAPGIRDVCSITKNSLQYPVVGTFYHTDEHIDIDIDKLASLNKLDREKFEGVMMHEMGHALGMEHVGVAPGDALMSPSAGLDFTDIDRVECIKIGLCNTL